MDGAMGDRDSHTDISPAFHGARMHIIRILGRRSQTTGSIEFEITDNVLTR